MFINSDYIPWESHKLWYKKTLSDYSKKIFIAQLGNNFVGMCMFSIQEDDAEISLNLNPLFRGMKLSSQILIHAINRYQVIDPNIKLSARIKRENYGSIKCFLNAGFDLTHVNEGYNFYAYTAK